MRFHGIIGYIKVALLGRYRSLTGAAYCPTQILLEAQVLSSKWVSNSIGLLKEHLVCSKQHIDSTTQNIYLRYLSKFNKLVLSPVSSPVLLPKKRLVAGGLTRARQ